MVEGEAVFTTLGSIQRIKFRFWPVLGSLQIKGLDGMFTPKSWKWVSLNYERRKYLALPTIKKHKLEYLEPDERLDP